MRIIIMLTLIMSAAAAAPADETMLLEADFDDKTVGDPIGTGGPELGEPIAVNWPAEATVVDGPLESPALRLEKTEDIDTTGWTTFEFMDEAQVATGHALVGFDLAMDTLDSYSVRFLEQGGYVHELLKLYTAGDSGNLNFADPGGFYHTAGPFAAGEALHVDIDFDMDAGTYTVWIDGEPEVEDRAHGIEEAGVGRILFSISHPSALEASFIFDNLEVRGSDAAPAAARSFSELKPSF